MTVAPDVHTKVDVQHSVSQRGSAWKQQVCKPGVSLWGFGNHSVLVSAPAIPAPKAVVKDVCTKTDALNERGQTGPATSTVAKELPPGIVDVLMWGRTVIQFGEVHKGNTYQEAFSDKPYILWVKQHGKRGHASPAVMDFFRFITAVETHAPATDHFIPHTNFVRLLKESGSLNRRCSCKRSWAQVDASASDVQVRISAKPLAH
jgi:hypothetical protein